MLGKLIKYEFKATRKFMLLAYVLLFVMSVIIGIGSRFDLGKFTESSSASGFGTMVAGLLTLVFVVAYVAVNCAVFAGMFFFAVNRFRHNILGNEGYLMHTLPVKSRDHILAKTLVSSIWTFCSFLVAALSYIVLFLIAFGSEIATQLPALFSEAVVSEAELSGIYMYVWEYVITVLLSVVAGYLQIYAAMSIGYCTNANRALISIAAYVGINIIWSFVESILSLPLSGISEMRLFSSDGVHAMLLITIASSMLKAVVCFYTANFFLSKKLNLQ